MGIVTCDLSISLDGFVAGPRQSQENPLGEGGMAVHEWHFDAEGVDAEIVEEWQSRPGAYVMGRNMFGPGRGEWDLDWRGWWGEDPPYHVPVFVLTHHPRDPLPMDGGTTFHFATDGIEAALAQAREAAGDRNVAIAGGASTVNQYLAAGLVDELHLHIAPLLLHGGERLFEGVPDLDLHPIGAVGTDVASHVRYRIG
jgi:dihydrofolate reductase